MLTLLVISMLTLAFNIQQVKAAISPYSPADAISVEPATATVTAYQTVTINITITNITDCRAYDLWLDYNDTILEVTNINIDTGTPGTPSQIAPDASDMHACRQHVRRQLDSNHN
jgi:hypothetical protein